MTTWQKATKAKIEACAELAHDKLMCHKDGTITVRFGFFYRHGRSEETCAQEVRKALPDATVVETRETWKQWPADSYWQVTIAEREAA